MATNPTCRLLCLFLAATLAQIPGAAAEEKTAKKLPEIQNKTLVAWVCVSDLKQRGGSALTLDDRNSHFDALVFGEVLPGRWMAGSDFYRRTQKDQKEYPAETSGPTTLVQIAAVYDGKNVSLYRNGQAYAHHEIAEPQRFGPGSAVLIGLRHILAGDAACFAGSIDDARIYNIALSAEQIAALEPHKLSDPKPLAWWTFEDGKAADRMGTFPAAKLVGGAKIAGGKLILDGKGGYMIAPESAAPAAPAEEPHFDSPIHYRPATARLADTIPFFWKGEYHIFYLRAVGKVPWEHIVSSDLVHWKELPTALVSDGAPDSPDGQHMFTGSVAEKDGTFHIFYTGHNDRNPAGVEFVMHATSPDLIHWTKHPEDILAPDGVHYKNHPRRDSRDPYVFWNEPQHCYWMVFFGNDAKTGAGVQGLAVSPDLKNWEFKAPLSGAGGQECPDLFSIGDTWYLVCADHYTYAKSPEGPYMKPPVSGLIDRPNIYAAKRMFDGKRHIWTGWIWDTNNKRDGGGSMWGGTQCLPRELYAGPDGQLYCKPVDEVVAVFNETVLDVAAAELSAAAPSRVFDVPGHYMLECEIRLDAKAQFTVAMRQQDEGGQAYKFVLNAEKNEAHLGGPGFDFKRPAPADTTKPIKFRAFVQGPIIECFVNEQYAQSCRAYNLKEGKLTFTVSGGSARIQALRVKVKGREK